MKINKSLFWVLLIVFVVAQFLRPQKNLGDEAMTEFFLAETNTPEEISLILDESCFDCHSNNTHYPWYNAITPVNYWLSNHINKGKKHLDFSKWKDYTYKQKIHKLEEITEMVEDKSMPLNSYLWVHDEAELNQDEIDQITAWVEATKIQIAK